MDNLCVLEDGVGCMNENVSSIEFEDYKTNVFSLKIYLMIKKLFDIMEPYIIEKN